MLESTEYQFPKTIDELDIMSGEEFEIFLFHYYLKEGFEVYRTSTYDYGIDLIIFKADKPEYRVGIQAKRFGKPIAQGHILKMINGKEVYFLSKMYIATNSTLSKRAHRVAANHKIESITRSAFEKMFENNTINTEQDSLLGQLKDLRKLLSEEYSVYPSYYVFNNDTLNELIKHKPVTLKALLDVKGFGDKKVAKYGDYITELFSNNI